MSMPQPMTGAGVIRFAGVFWSRIWSGSHHASNRCKNSRIELFLIPVGAGRDMKISDEMKKQLNEQIAMEANASQIYLAMASWTQAKGYEGAASFFYGQSAEERVHMLKFIGYVNTVGAEAVIPKIDKPPADTFETLEGILATALKYEQATTKAIHRMAKTAQKDIDYSTFDFLSWFVKEQVEEESQFEDLLQKFELIGRDGIAINEIDKILAVKGAAFQPVAAEPPPLGPPAA